MQEFLAVCIMAVVMLCVSVAIGYIYNQAECNAKWELADYPHKYSFIGGCQVKTDHGWLPSENVRNVD